MQRSPKSVLGLYYVWTLLIVSTFGCVLPDYDFCRIRPKPRPLEQIEREILALELRGKDLQQVAAALATKGFRDSGRHDDHMFYKRHAGTESIDMGKCDYVVFQKGESVGILESRDIAIACILEENDLVKDLLFSEFYTGP